MAQVTQIIRINLNTRSLENDDFCSKKGQIRRALNFSFFFSHNFFELADRMIEATDIVFFLALSHLG